MPIRRQRGPARPPRQRPRHELIPNLTRGGAPYALIENVVTHPDHRKRGYGKAVLTEAIAVAWRHGCYKVMLLTGSRRPSTLKFYADVGFEQTKTGFQVRRIAARADKGAVLGQGLVATIR